MTQIVPHLMFQGDLQAALDLWTRAFGPFETDVTARDEAGAIMQARVTLHGQTISLFDSPIPHDFSFTPSFSWMITCDSVEDGERLAAILGDGGTIRMPADAYDFAPWFTWVDDPFGVSWQIMVAP